MVEHSLEISEKESLIETIRNVLWFRSKFPARYPEIVDSDLLEYLGNVRFAHVDRTSVSGQMSGNEE